MYIKDCGYEYLDLIQLTLTQTDVPVGIQRDFMHAAMNGHVQIIPTNRR